MELESITADCIALSDKIAGTISILSTFVREIREVRSDIDGISRELHSLQNVLDLLKGDAALFPAELAEQTPAVLRSCSKLADEVDAFISVLSSPGVSKQDRRCRWLESGRQHSARLRSIFEAHKAVLGLALDLVGATAIRAATAHTTPGKRNTVERLESSADVIQDVTRVLIEMDQLRMRLPGEFEKKESDFSLYDYLKDLKAYAEAVIERKESEHGEGSIAERGSEEAEARVKMDQGAYMGEDDVLGAYLGDTPDSAIEMHIESPANTFKDASLSSEEAARREINSLINDMLNVPGRAPTPPPKDRKRLEIARTSVVSPFESPPPRPKETLGVFTQISSEHARSGTQGSIGRGFGRIFSPFKNAMSERRPQSRSTTASTVPTEARPETPIIQASLVRRGSHRLSVSFKKLPKWNGELMVEEAESPGANSVFGVPLARSMQVAKGTAKTHHSGNGGSSRRDFPLCMQKCCFFLKHEGTVTPDIFAEQGDGYRVQKLRDAFSAPPTYGEDLGFDDYSVYDVADLVLLFLSQLPKPLIPETVAKRWISLSRQATISGSHGTRLDQCIDFWEEALGGLRGPSRSLFKLLLNLWADIADEADRNDMTAERLAGAVLKPLMHVSSSKYQTDYLLSLAFLIRKRSEYAELLKQGRSEVKRVSKAAW